MNGRSSSVSLGKQLLKRFPIILTARKLSKMVKEKEKFFMRSFMVTKRKRIGTLLLCAIGAAIFFWALNNEQGEGSQQVNSVQNNNVNESIVSLTSNLALPPPLLSQFLGYTLPPGHPCNSFTLPPPPADKKRTGPRPCPVCYLPLDEAIALMPKFPSPSPVLQNLTFIHEEPLRRDGEFGGSDFGGYPTLKQRTYSHTIQPSMNIHCGFVRGTKPGRNTGFDMDEDDLVYMEQCTGVVVASYIFGNFDDINEPSNISDYSKKTVCFLMFIDEETEKYQRSTGRLDSSKKVGVWRVIVTRNPPYTDGRRTGKIPKLLIHRMTPNARYAICIDGKLELLVDPYRILERFLWRKNATFAISRHYKRFDVFVEAEANKAAGKYDNASIDFQIEFYKKEGLTPYTEDKYPIISDVPEGCVIVRELIPISNLFTCLWFNEVDRFTSRDQISFSTVRDKLLSQVDFHFNMFQDCERRNFVVQKYHREVLERIKALNATRSQPLSPPPPSPLPPPPPPPLLISPPVMADPQQQWKDWRLPSMYNRKVFPGNGDTGAT